MTSFLMQALQIKLKLKPLVFCQVISSFQNLKQFSQPMKNVISKAWDNRFGVLMVTELLESLKGQKLDNTLIAGANVQKKLVFAEHMSQQLNSNQNSSLLLTVHLLATFMATKAKSVTEHFSVSTIQDMLC